MENLQAAAERRRVNRILLLTLLLYLALSLVASVVILLLGMEDILQQYSITTLLVELGAFYVPAWCYMQRRREKDHFFAQRVSFAELLWSVFLGIGVFFLTSGLATVWSLLLEWLHVPMLSGSIPTETGWRFYAAAVLVALIPAITEEQLFRGLLLRTYSRSDGWKMALIHTSLLFGLMHLQITSLPIFVLIGWVLGKLTQMSRSYYSAMVVHGVYNLLALMFATAAQESGAASVGEGLAFTTTEVLGSVLFYVIIGGVCSYASWRVLTKCVENVKERAALPRTDDGAGEKALERFRRAEEPCSEPREKFPKGSWLLILSYIVLVAANVAALFV